MRVAHPAGLNIPRSATIDEEGCMQVQEISVRLFNAALARAQQDKFRFGAGADGDIRGHANDAAVRIRDAAVAENVPIEPLIKKGEDVFRQLIEGMIAERANIPDYERIYPDVLGERTLGRALLALCPLWPLCV
jgi:hypothetical protein